MGNKTKVEIIFSDGTIRTYYLRDTLDKALSEGKSVIVEFKHTVYGEMFIAKEGYK